MQRVVIYGVGSLLVVDAAESLARAGYVIAAGIHNVEGPVRLQDEGEIVPLWNVTPDLAALPFIVPLFRPANRLVAAREAREHGFANPLSLIDPTSIVPRMLDHGQGLYINCGVTVGAAGRMGAFVLVNRGASIGHHAELDDLVSVGPGAVLGGSVRVGKGAVIGAGAVVLPERRIGAHAVVGAGAVVTRDVPAAATVVGNPARVVRRDSGAK